MEAGGTSGATAARSAETSTACVSTDGRTRTIATGPSAATRVVFVIAHATRRNCAVRKGKGKRRDGKACGGCRRRGGVQPQERGKGRIKAQWPAPPGGAAANADLKNPRVAERVITNAKWVAVGFADDHMVQERDIHDLEGLPQGAGNPDIGRAGRGITGRMSVRNDGGGCAGQEADPENFPGMDQGRREGSERDHGPADWPVLPIEWNHPKGLLLVIIADAGSQVIGDFGGGRKNGNVTEFDEGIGESSFDYLHEMKLPEAIPVRAKCPVIGGAPATPRKSR